MGTHVMLDLETWGTGVGCAIRSIGAVAFDPKSMLMGPSFYMTVDDGSCEAAGLTKDDGTVKWWGQQTQEARDALSVLPSPVVCVCDAFSSWFAGLGGRWVWGHGGSFDAPILKHAMVAAGTGCPWDFRNERCTRTAYQMLGVDMGSVPRAGTHHNSLDDAKHQVRVLFEGLRLAPTDMRDLVVRNLGS